MSDYPAQNPDTAARAASDGSGTSAATVPGTGLSREDARLRRTGLMTFCLSGICSISSGIIVSVLRDKYSLSFGLTGSMLSMMSIGNVIAAFLAGFLPARIGQRRMVLIMSAGFCIGYLMTVLSGVPGLLLAAFLIVGLAKGCCLNTDSVLVGQHTLNRARDMQIMHSCYAVGALSCPFIISGLTGVHVNAPMIGIALFGVLLWLVYFAGRLPGKAPAGAVSQLSSSVSGSRAASSGTDSVQSGGNAADMEKQQAHSPRMGQPAANTDKYGFLRSAKFWLLTALIFCQNAAETCVTGWLVTYYKDQNILTGALAGYTMTIMWGATLIGRLLIAFVIPIRNRYKALTIMGIGCTIMYAILIRMSSPVPAILSLFLFSFSMAGVNPMGTASVGDSLSSESMGILLPIGGIGGILFPMLVGFIADDAGLHAGMMINLFPCVGLVIISLVLLISSRKQ